MRAVRLRWRARLNGNSSSAATSSLLRWVALKDGSSPMREQQDVGVHLSALESAVWAVKTEDELAVGLERCVDGPVVLQIARLPMIKQDPVREARGSIDARTEHNERRSARRQAPQPMSFAAAY